jgi:hypothetical protein
MDGLSTCSLVSLTEESTSLRDGKCNCAQSQTETIKCKILKSGYERSSGLAKAPKCARYYLSPCFSEHYLPVSNDVR